MESLRILVAEDDVVVAEDLRRALVAMGHEVAAVVPNGEDLARAASERSVELALLGIGMPVPSDRIEAARRLTEDFDIPVVFVGEHVDDETASRACEAEPMGYLLKPLDARQLRTVIELAARRHARERRVRRSAMAVGRAQALLERSERRHRTLFRDSPAALYAVSLKDGTIKDVNEGLLSLFGWQRNELVGHTTDAAGLWPRTDDRHGLFGRLGHDGAIEGLRVPFRTRTGDVREIEVSVRRAELDGEPTLLVACHHVTRNPGFEVDLERMALYDGLTGLANRHLFRDRLKQSIERGRREDRRVAVIYIDLDRFKVVNDTLGHRAGDQVLALVADRLRSCFRDEDTVARIGGDEFAVVVVERDAGGGGAEAAAERILRELERPLDVSGVEVRLGASVGIAFAPRHGSSVGDLLRHSDSAMYEAKSEGGARHRVFAMSAGPAGSRQGEAGKELESAMEKDELRLVFQPVVALDDGRMVGVEAFLRWIHPERGVLAPADFLPLADEVGLTFPLGQHVMAMVTGHLSAWEGRLPEEFYLSVNLLPRFLGHRALADHVSSALELSGVDPRRLVVEVTEGAILLAPERLRTLRALGVRVALDDFGTGRSPLTYLDGLELDYLKLDRSMTAHLGRRWSDFVITRSVILCAEGLGLDVVAEGVESSEQAGALAELGCPYAQGFLYAHPMEESALLELLSGEA